MISEKTKFMVMGCILGLGSPLGWLLIRFLCERPDHLTQWCFLELSRSGGLYLYLTLGTVISFSTFGYFVGHLFQKLVEKDELLERKNRDYMKIVGFVAHELRTPLTSIKGRIDLALDGHYGNLNPKFEEALQKAEFGCNQINEMISRYLDLARIERGELNVKLREVRILSQIFLPVIEEFRGILEAKGMRIDVKNDQGGDYPVYGDPQWLKVAFRNLFANAIRYGYSDTVIELRLREESSGLKVEVFNRGYGIPQDCIQKIFERFEKVPRMGAIGEVGTGLGLFIVKEIVEQHAGSVRCESQAGEWANFIVMLPMGK